MLKPQKYNIDDTNIANLGTELEKKVKKAAAETEDAWKGVGKQVGMWIWRIEKFKVVPWPKEHYGSFFSGDSFILLKVSMHTFFPHLFVGSSMKDSFFPLFPALTFFFSSHFLFFVFFFLSSSNSDLQEDP